MRVVVLSLCLSFSLFAVNDEAQSLVRLSRTMQDSGSSAPVPYYYFGMPSDCLSIASRFLPANPVVVVGGAFNGRESCAIANFWPKGHVHAFEPVKQIYEVLVANTKSMQNISTYRMALGNQVGSQLIYLSTEYEDLSHISMSSSLLPPKEHLLYSGTLFQGGELVAVTTLDAWAKEKGIDKVDMLWLDMQGFELPALKEGMRVLSKVSVILTELEFVEAYENQPLYREVKSWLEDQGFVLIAGNFTFPKASNQWFGDGVFVRKELLGIR